MTDNKHMDTDFIETFGAFSINPQQVTNVECFENALYFYFNNSNKASMRIKFEKEEHALASLEGFKMCVARKQIEGLNNDRD